MAAAQFRRYIGIDYSGAETSESRLAGLRAFDAGPQGEPCEQNTTTGDGSLSKHMRWNWTRKELAHWLLNELRRPEPVIVGIDHGFSFPESCLNRYGLRTWDDFLEDFCTHWPTDQDGVYVDDIREGKPARTGRMNEFRVTDRRAKGTQSVFKFDGAGTVGKSTHTGIPWLRFLRGHKDLDGRIHFWPFDGFEVPEDSSVVAEVWPTLFRRMYHCPEGRTKDQHDAYAVARWFQEMDSAAGLARFLRPVLSREHEMIVRREGWILGAP